jgi:formate dehydrogenase maturation protein FdhE
MLQLHPEPLTKNGQGFVVLPYAEFQQIQKLLEDLEDLEDLRQAKAEQKDDSTYSLEVVKNILFQSEHNWENALEQLKTEIPENQAEKIKKLFDSWDQFNDEARSTRNLRNYSKFRKSSHLK